MRPTVQVLPDRTVYSLDKNIQSMTSSLSDVLRDLPSVDVDIQGNVSLRGDSNVTILVDGKQSALMAGNRGDALQQIPANMVERIEVITNPSAEFRAEGSGGIINIVMRKDKEQVASGVVRINVGNEGRINGSLSGNVKLDRLSLNGSYSERRDVARFESSTVRSDGTTMRSSQNATSKGVSAGRIATLTAHLSATDRDNIELGGNYNRFAARANSSEHNISVLAGTDVIRNGVTPFQQEGTQLRLNYRHNFETQGEEFNLDLSRSLAWARNGFEYTTIDVATDLPNFWQSRGRKWRGFTTELGANYILPLPHQGKFKAGYSLQIDSVITDKFGVWRTPSTTDWAVDSNFTSLFALDRTIQAGYVSYEQKFGAFGVMAGLRLEHDDLATNLKTTGEVHNTETLGFYPSLHLTYNLTDTRQFKLSYSRRMNRPDTGSLNPTRFSADAFNEEAGNPLLKPEQIDSFESSYRYTGEKMDGVVTGFYRATYHGITNVYRLISDTVMFMTRDNLARRMASGVEGNFNATLIPDLSLRLSGRISYDEFNPGPSAVSVKQSGIGWNSRSGIDWQITPDDQFQFNVRVFGKQKFAQGYNEPGVTGSLGYKHTFDNGLAAVFSVNNLFDSLNRNSVLDSPGVHQVDQRAMNGRQYYLGLVYTFGGAKDTQGVVSDREVNIGGGP